MMLFELLNARTRATTAESSYPIVRRTTAYRNKAHLLHRAVYIGRMQCEHSAQMTHPLERVIRSHRTHTHARM
jgi:hypothetical protein